MVEILSRCLTNGISTPVCRIRQTWTWRIVNIGGIFEGRHLSRYQCFTSPDSRYPQVTGHRLQNSVESAPEKCPKRTAASVSDVRSERQEKVISQRPLRLPWVIAILGPGRAENQAMRVCDLPDHWIVGNLKQCLVVIKRQKLSAMSLTRDFHDTLPSPDIKIVFYPQNRLMTWKHFLKSL